SGPLRDIAHCHCSICRRTSGGIVTTWITLPLASFHWSHGKPGEYASSASCTRYFCRGCGCQLALFTTHSPGTLDVTVATLDEAAQAPADRHIWVGSRLPWLQLDPQLPEEDEEQP
ncbi:MAG TPA: GFA family protein, partial [Pseudomonas sp.]|nr:GFA family protein [Pseudomonas sp.]